MEDTDMKYKEILSPPPTKSVGKLTSNICQ